MHSSLRQRLHRPTLRQSESPQTPGEQRKQGCSTPEASSSRQDTQVLLPWRKGRLKIGGSEDTERRVGQRMAVYGTCGPAGRPEGGTDCTAQAQRDRDNLPSRSRSSAPVSRAAPRTGRSRIGEPANQRSYSARDPRTNQTLALRLEPASATAEC